MHVYSLYILLPTVLFTLYYNFYLSNCVIIIMCTCVLLCSFQHNEMNWIGCMGSDCIYIYNYMTAVEDVYSYTWQLYLTVCHGHWYINWLIYMHACIYKSELSWVYTRAYTKGTSNDACMHEYYSAWDNVSLHVLVYSLQPVHAATINVSTAISALAIYSGMYQQFNGNRSLYAMALEWYSRIYLCMLSCHE